MALEGPSGPLRGGGGTHTFFKGPTAAVSDPASMILQGLSSQLSGLQIDISQSPEQLEISLKHQYVPYLVQFYTYFFIFH